MKEGILDFAIRGCSNHDDKVTGGTEKESGRGAVEYKMIEERRPRK